MARPLLEIAVDSLRDAIAATEAGADRLELVAHLDRHGLTPDPSFIREVKAAVHIPLMAMLRPDTETPVADQRMVARLLNQAEDLLTAGADGIVFGVLTPHGHVDRDATAMLVQLAGARQTVFHRAFDLTQDPLATIDTLVDRGVTRILTSGLDSRATAAALGLVSSSSAPGLPPPGLAIRLKRIRAFVDAAAGRIEILPCGGVRSANARQFLDETAAVQLHSASRTGQGFDAREAELLRAAMS